MKTLFRLLASVIILAACPFALATTIVVTSIADSGAGSLRQALADVDDGDTIVFNVPGPQNTITLTSGELLIEKDMTIRGPGPASLIVARSLFAAPFRVFEIKPTYTVTIEGITIANGLAEGYYPDASRMGGGIYNNHATLNIVNCIVTNNQARDIGGGICNDGSRSPVSIETAANLTITNSSISNNSAWYGGGIYNSGYIKGAATLAINNSTISSNSSITLGGGIYNESAHASTTLSVNNSTLTGNFTQQEGGAIYSHGIYGAAMLTITNSTFSGNSAGLDGNGVYAAGTGASTSIMRVGNTILNDGGGSGTIDNIVNDWGSVASLGYNLSNDAGVRNIYNGTGGLDATSDRVNTNPLLDPAGLQSNGGPTKAIALLPNSPAINTGDRNAPSRDQRYYLRNGAPDRGAAEYGGRLAPLRAASRKTHASTREFDVDLPLTGAAGIECRSGGANNEHQMAVTFASPVSVSNAGITSGGGSLGTVNVNGPEVIVNLIGIGNAQRIVLMLFGVNDGANTNDATIQMAVLLGDVNGNGVVNATDVSQTKSHLGEPILQSNFRADLNANGTINAGDVGIIKSNVGTGLP